MNFLRNFVNFICLDNWNGESHPLQRNEYGVWSIKINDQGGKPGIQHATRVKLVVTGPNGEKFTRVPGNASP